MYVHVYVELVILYQKAGKSQDTVSQKILTMFLNIYIYMYINIFIFIHCSRNNVLSTSRLLYSNAKRDRDSKL